MPNISDNDALKKIYRKSRSLNIDQIRELLHGDYSLLVTSFIMEVNYANTPFEVSQVWKRWLPLVRDETFVQTLEQITSQMETEASASDKRAFERMREMAREFNRMTEEEVKQYFQSRTDPQKFDTAFTEDQARAEHETAKGAAAQGDLVGARIHYERAIVAFQHIGNDQMLAQSILNLANLLGKEGQLSQAEKLYKQAAVTFERLGDTTNLGLTFYNLGHCMFLTRQLARAHQFAEQGLRVLIPGKPRADQVADMCADLMMKVAMKLPLPDQVKQYRKIAQVLEELKLQSHLARAYLLMGGALAQTEQFNEGCEVATKGVKLMVASGSPKQVQWALHLHGLIWNMAGNPRDEWLKVSKELLATPDWVNQLGDMCLALTMDVDSRKLSLNDARRRLREAHDCEPLQPQAVAVLAADIGKVVEQIKMMPVEALKKLEVNANLYQKIGRLHEAEGAASCGLQVIAGLQGLTPQVLARLKATEGDLHTILGIVHKYNQRYTSAEKHFQRSIDLYRETKNHEMEWKTLGNLAGVRLVVGDVVEALRLYNLSYQMIKELPAEPSHSFIYAGLAAALLAVSQKDKAYRMASLALKMNPPADEAAQCVSVLLDTATGADRLKAEEAAEQLLAANPTPAVQLDILSRLSSQAGASPKRKRKWQTRLRKIGDSLDGLQRAYMYLKLADLHNDTKAGRKAAIEDLEHCMSLVDEVAANNPDHTIQREFFVTGNRAAQRLLQLKSDDDRACLEILLRAKARATLHEGFTTAYTLDELEAQLTQQRAPVLLVEMYVLPTESLLYFVTAEGLQGVEHIPVTTEVLMAENGIITKLGNAQHYKAAWESETWMHLSAQFADALAHHLQPGQLVCLIPAGFWHFLPLHACTLNDCPLIESHPVYYGPSSSILSRAGDAQRNLRRCLAVGVEFEHEAEWVAEWFGGQVVLGSSADATVIAELMVDKDVVHFSCHGAYNPLRASESGLKLGHHSWLTPIVIEQRTTAADLVTLAACETAFDFVSAGNDVVGIDQAFLNMGAVSVLGTLWEVETKSTECFVKAFYEHLTGACGTSMKLISKAHALQAAVAQVRTNKDFCHPYYWAPFKLSGGWL